MIEDYDWDIYETFKEQLDSQLPHIEYHILLLEQKDLVSDSLNELFRYFHSYKATSAYLSLTPLYNIVCKTETVLSSLREEKNIVQNSIIAWLLQIKDKLREWSQEMEDRERNLSPVPQKLLNKIKITDSYINPKDKLKTLSILYMDKNIARAKKVVPFLRKFASSVKYSSESDRDNTVLNMNPYDIIITNLDKENHSIISFCKQSYPDIPIIAIFNKISTVCSKKLIKNGISHAITNPLNGKIIERELISIAKVFYSSRNILINHKKIHDFIQTLEPLPNTIFKVMQICDDEEIPIKDLIKVVKTDPIIAAHILNVANSPIYGSIELKTIDQAVTKFGKRAVKALCMSGMYQSLGSINLSAYDINEEIFSTVAMTRLSLMLKWYSKISISDLSVLSSTALMSNIGQLLISKELIEIHQDDRFQELCTAFDIQYAEESTVHTTTNQISSQILNYWKLSKDIVDVISYSDNPLESPEELRKLSAANCIVCKLIDVKGNILSDIPDEILAMMDTYGFDPAPLNKALKSLK